MKKESQTIKLLIQECNDLKKQIIKAENKIEAIESDFQAAMSTIRLMTQHSIWKWDA